MTTTSPRLAIGLGALAVATLAPLSAARAVTVDLEPGADVAALTASLGPGDEFIFHAGTYDLPGPLTWSGDGTETEPIRFHSAGDGAVILRLVAGGHVLRVSESTFIEVTGLTLTGADELYDAGTNYHGFLLNNSADVTVRDCEVVHVGGTGVAFQNDVQRATFTHNHIHDVRTGTGLSMGCGDASCWTSDSDISGNLIHDVLGDRRIGVDLLPGGQGNQLTDNIVFNTTWTGLSVSDTAFGDANTVTGNVIWNAVDTGLRVDGAAVVQNNLVFLIDGVGVRATDWHDDSLQDVVITHNTIVDTTDWGARVYAWAGRAGMVFANNAIANPTGRAFHADADGLDEGNRVVGNVMTGLVEGLSAELGQFTPGGGYDDFEDAAVWDFYPTPTSHLLGAGDTDPASWVPATDFSAFARDGLAPDVGAYEFITEGNPGWVVREDFKQDAEAPFVDDETVGGCCQKNGSSAGLFLLPGLALFVRRRRQARK